MSSGPATPVASSDRLASSSERLSRPGPLFRRAEVIVLGLAGLVGRLPRKWVFRLGGLLRWFLWLIPARKKQRVLRNLELAGAEDPQKEMVNAAVGLGESLFDIVWCLRRSKREILEGVWVEGLDELREAASEGGVLLATAHYGNWEVVGALSAEAGRCATIARRLRARRFEEKLTKMRRRVDLETLQRGEAGASIAISRWLARGGIFIVMMDRASSGRRREVPFLGQTTMMPLGPAIMAHRFGSAVFVAVAHREPKGSWRVCFRRLDLSRVESAEDLADAVAAALEQQVRHEPGRWYWIARRQKARG